MNQPSTELVLAKPDAIANQKIKLIDRIPSWLPWLSGRLASGLLVVFVISFIVFGATQALPSDPARIILGPEASEQSINILREQLGLNKPIAVQYLHWVQEILSGNLGTLMLKSHQF